MKLLVLIFLINGSISVHVVMGENHGMDIKITKQWDSTDIDHKPVEIELDWNEGDDFLTLEFEGPFFNDPKAPAGKAGEPFPELWEYEVAEIFFLAPNKQYLEIEVCPHGQHLLIMLNGTRNPIKDKLPIKYTAEINKEEKTWSGKAEIPLSYLPHGVSKLNAFAIHGTCKDRVYEALYPVPKGKFDTPDYHRLEYFQEFAIGKVVKDTSTIGKYWDEL